MSNRFAHQINNKKIVKFYHVISYQTKLNFIFFLFLQCLSLYQTILASVAVKRTEFDGVGVPFRFYSYIRQMLEPSVWNTPNYFDVDFDIEKERHLVESIIPAHKVIYSSQNFRGVTAKLFFPLIVKLLPKPLLSEDMCNEIMKYDVFGKKGPLVKSIVTFKVKKNNIRIFEQLIRLEDFMRDYPQSYTSLGEGFCFKLAQIFCGDKFAHLSFNTNVDASLSFVSSINYIRDEIRRNGTVFDQYFKNAWKDEVELPIRLKAMWKEKCPYLQY